MGVQITYGTAGATGGGWSAQPGTLQPAYGEQRHDPKWQWQQRTLRTRKDPMAWRSKWSFGCKIGYGMPSGNDGAAPIGMNETLADPFMPLEIQDGCQTLKFIKGLCVDTSDAALSGVTVQAFRTSDDAFAGYEVQSRTDGSYDLPTNFPGVNHYVVAYLPGSPDRTGATVNTLVPANIDGT